MTNRVIIPISILFQNHDLLVVDKPPGLSVHNNEDAQNLLKLLNTQLGLMDIYPVHRLDKETSGVQLLALQGSAAKALSDEFQNRLVKKTYVGILRGQLQTQKGSWTLDLTDKAEGRNNPRGLAAERVPCETGFEVREKSQYFTSCQFALLTGRQHQIRKHAALANHCLVGDPRYGDKKYNQKIFSLYDVQRMFLHCTRIEIADMVFESAAPKEFANLFQ